jgi:hypothetical protein
MGSSHINEGEQPSRQALRAQWVSELLAISVTSRLPKGTGCG